MPNASDLFSIVDSYIGDLYAPEDDVLLAALGDARAAGLPEIQVSPAQAKFLYLMARLVGARRILELGTLGGYSTIWLARSLPPGGRLTTFEVDPKHAAVATRNIARAGLADVVDVIVGPATETLPRFIDADEAAIDLVFLDADKVNYGAYFAQFMRRVHGGSLILADNVIRQGTVLSPSPGDPSALAARVFNAMIATDERLEAVILQQVGIKGHDGLTVARVK
ncbi:MAG TPA: O-methyltransferase [Caulobacteraceae bacterium]|jgi:predicted O-methyltransferase YrrM